MSAGDGTLAGGGSGSAGVSTNESSMRHCKAFLRRRLAYGPSPPDAISASRVSTDAQHEAGESSKQAQHTRWWPVGREEQCEQLRGVLRRTVIDHESQSALLLGYTGSGKSLVLDRVLRALAEETVTLAQGRRRGKGKKRPAPSESSGRQDDAIAGGEVVDVGANDVSTIPFRAVYLNGLVQTDDGIAMREVVQQLGITGRSDANYASNLEMAVERMKMGAVEGLPVVFVLDEFERFASRKPQTLLYALLDLCQDKSICAAVVGLSVNLNVLDAAEKRIKSRFSFRQIRFPLQDFDTLLTILTDALTLPVIVSIDGGGEAVLGAGAGVVNSGEGEEEATVTCLVPGVSASFAREFNATTRQVLLGTKHHNSSRGSSSGGGSLGGGGAAARSRSATGGATADLRAFAAGGRTSGWFCRLASTAVSLLRAGEDKGLTSAAIARAGEMLAPDVHAQALRGLSVTQVMVLVAFSRLGRRGRECGCSFHVIFREYESYLRKFPHCHLHFSREVLFKAFQQMVEQGLLRAAECATGGGREVHPLLHTRFRSRYHPDDILDALIKDKLKAPTNVTQWCKNWEKDA